METIDTTRSDILTAAQKLLADGALSYLDALMALREFRHIVQTRCREVLLAHRDAFTQATGLLLTQGQIQDYADPDGTSRWDGGWAWLGVRTQLGNYGRAYFCLTWTIQDNLQPLIAARVMVEPNTRPLFEKTWEMLKDAPGFENTYSWEIDVSQPVPPAQILTFGDILAGVIAIWASAGQLVGGLQRIIGGSDKLPSQQ